MFVTYGAKIESWLAPPLERQFSNVTRTAISDDGAGGFLSLLIQGEKLRDCPAQTVAAQWVLASGVVPVAMTRTDGTVVPTTGGGGNFRAGDTFILGPYTVRIPMTAAADPTAMFRVTNVYQCHFLWPLTVATSIALADVPVAP